MYRLTLRVGNNKLVPINAYVTVIGREAVDAVYRTLLGLNAVVVVVAHNRHASVVVGVELTVLR